MDTTGGLSLHWLTAPLLTAFLLSWPVSLLPDKWSGMACVIVGEPVLAICLVDGYCQEFLMTPVTPQILNNVLLSNPREAFEFFSTFVGWHVLLRWRMALLVLLALGLPLLCWQADKLSLSLPMKRVWNKRASGLLMTFVVVYELLPLYHFSQLFWHGNDTQKMEGLIYRHYHDEIPTPLHRYAFASYAIRQSSKHLEAIRQSTFSAQIDSCSHLSPHIVLVIGESYNKHHASLYGYRLPTTPCQQRRQREGELYVFTDVVTPWNITSNVFLDIFSLWQHGVGEPVTRYPLFPVLFRCAGYQVNFFSNQFMPNGFFRRSTNQAGHFFLADNSICDTLFSYRNKQPEAFDMGMVGQVSEYKAHRDSPYTLDIVHLYGQHFEYAERYPKSQGVFSAKDYRGRKLDAGALAVVRHYDNAVRYNDAVVDSLLTLYEKEDAIVIYVADHGEEIYDELPVKGRLFQEPNAAQAKNEYEVPMWIWCSEAYMNRHQGIVQSIRQSVRKPFVTDAMPQMLLSLAGIFSRWNDDSSNLLSPDYQCHQRMIGGSQDYDQLRSR